MQHVVIAVPEAEALELARLQDTLPQNTTPIQSKPFDGVTMLQILVPVTVASIPIIKTWVKARFEHRKTQAISFKGMKFTGYSATEVKELIELLDSEIAAGSDDAG